jgi:hypothetical protein
MEFTETNLTGSITQGWYFTKFEQSRVGTIQLYAYAPKLPNQIGNRTWRDKAKAMEDMKAGLFDGCQCFAGD